MNVEVRPMDQKTRLYVPRADQTFVVVSDEEREQWADGLWIEGADRLEYRATELTWAKKGTRKLLFVDRDGVLIRDTGYPSKVEDLIFLDEGIPLWTAAREAGFELVVVTNQAGVARGYFDLATVTQINQAIAQHYREQGVVFLDWQVCPYHFEHGQGEWKKFSVCRKPMPGMVLKALAQWQGELAECFMIGDRESDRLAWINLPTFLVNERHAPPEKRTPGALNFTELRERLPF